MGAEQSFAATRSVSEEGQKDWGNFRGISKELSLKVRINISPLPSLLGVKIVNLITSNSPVKVSYTKRNVEYGLIGINISHTEDTYTRTLIICDKTNTIDDNIGKMFESVDLQIQYEVKY